MVCLLVLCATKALFGDIIITTFLIIMLATTCSKETVMWAVSRSLFKNSMHVKREIYKITFIQVSCELIITRKKLSNLKNILKYLTQHYLAFKRKHRECNQSAIRKFSKLKYCSLKVNFSTKVLLNIQSVNGIPKLLVDLIRSISDLRTVNKNVGSFNADNIDELFWSMHPLDDGGLVVDKNRICKTQGFYRRNPDDLGENMESSNCVGSLSLKKLTSIESSWTRVEIPIKFS